MLLFKEIDVIPSQSLNAFLPNFFKFVGKEILVNLTQCSKVFSFISDTFEGIFIDDNELQ